MTIFRSRRAIRRYEASCSAFALVFVLASVLSAMGQQAAGFQHLDPQAMSPTDSAVLQSRRSEIIESAEIYGYNLVAGNWTYRQTLCAPLPQTILLHYSERFPDGTESLFTALVPRGQGRVRIVPVLYRNATPFVPAPRNPRNYALFNSLVPQNIAAQELASLHNWLELSACYAEMAGADINIPKGGSVEAGVASAPTATIHIDSQHKSSLVTFADRETRGTFRVWSISYNHAGRVTAAGTEAYPVYPSRTAAPQPVEAAQTPEATAPEQAPAPVEASVPTQPSSAPPLSASTVKANTVAEGSASSTPAPQPAAPANAVEQTSQTQTTEPGWKFIPQAPQPPSKIIVSAPQPPSKIVPPPPNR